MIAKGVVVNRNLLDPDTRVLIRPVQEAPVLLDPLTVVPSKLGKSLVILSTSPQALPPLQHLCKNTNK